MYNSVWYYSLNRPPFLPSATVFQIAWIALYSMIFISFMLYLTRHTERTKIFGYILFVIQMILNLVWPFIFFYFQNISFALVILILLDITVLFTIKEFYQTSKKAAYFLFPYFIWIIFATYLNVGFTILN